MQPLSSNALDSQELFRRFLKHLQRLQSELIDDLLCHRFLDAVHGRGKIGNDAVLCRRNDLLEIVDNQRVAVFRFLPRPFHKQIDDLVDREKALDHQCIQRIVKLLGYHILLRCFQHRCLTNMKASIGAVIQHSFYLDSQLSHLFL